MQHKCDNINYSRLEDLLTRTGFAIKQENGQRIYYDPSNIEAPPRGTEIFVGCLPRNVYEDEIVPVLEQVGQLYNLRLMLEFNGRNRGFCFASYMHKDQAQAAIEMLNGYELRPGCKIGIFKSIDNTRLFVGGIPSTVTAEQVLEAFEQFVDGVREVIMYPSNVDQGVNRGYVFVEFESHRYAAIARRRLQPGSLILWDSPIMVDWAEPLPDPGPAVMAKVTKLYCRNLGLDLTCEQFHLKLSEVLPNNCIIKVYKSNDYAFVHFSTRAAAEDALTKLQGMEIEGRKMEVTWARPEYYSNSNMKYSKLDHFCLSIPAKFRRIIKMRQQQSKMRPISPTPQNSFMYAPNAIPMQPVMPTPIAYSNFDPQLKPIGIAI